jgi:hypothetical protein
MSTRFKILLISLFIAAGYLVYEASTFFSFIPSAHSLEFDEQTFTELASDIVRQKQIFEMDDCSRSTRRLNSVYIRMTELHDKSDSLCCPDYQCCPIYYKRALDSLQVDHPTFQDFKQRLLATELRSFYKDGENVLFIVDGFLGDSWGFLYRGNRPSLKEELFKMGHYSVKDVDSINPTWRRVAIN